jgi:hypothetical protein
MSARRTLDRREFVAAAAAATGASCLPLGFAARAIAGPRAEAGPRVDDWTIDDMWGVYPRPSEPIGFGRPRGDGEQLAAVHPVDAHFVV